MNKMGEDNSKLKGFNNRNKYIIFCIFLSVFSVIVGVVIQKTFASYEITKKFNVIEGTVKYEGTGDAYVAAYIDGVKTDKFPSKIDYTYDAAQSNCTNEAVLNFDIVNWIGTVSNLIKPNTKCNLYFNSRPKYDNKIYEMMVRLEQEDNTQLAYDGTVDNNLRYIGADPYNYVIFNGELWRIIGSFNNIDDGLGRTEWRTKIIRNDSIGSRVWDAGNVNDWYVADIKDELNGTYLNGLSEVASSMIGETMWNIGGSSTNIQSVKMFYTQETSEMAWIGKVALMYGSDYGYAVGGENRDTCLDKTMNTYNTMECYNHDWLFNNTNQWLLTTHLGNTHTVYAIHSGGFVSYGDATNAIEARPVLYLASNVYISSGSGTSADPYQLSVQ